MELILLELINICIGAIDTDAYEAVMHYYKHDEYEMALEGLIIELVSTKYPLSKIKIKELLNLAKYYKLDTDSVFDADIWNKLMQWVKL